MPTGCIYDDAIRGFDHVIDHEFKIREDNLDRVVRFDPNR